MQIDSAMQIDIPPTTSPSPAERAAQLLRIQRTLFRGFCRYTNGFKVEEINAKWELEHTLKRVQKKWDEIETYHNQIDTILQGSDVEYEDEFICYEKSFEALLKALNERLASTSHLHNSTPKLEVPVFEGSYTQWPTFLELFSESIHNNHLLTKCQKMQHLKSKLQSEPERLVRHLHISSENYETAWELLKHRYNNPLVLFTKHMEIFLNQSHATKQTCHDIRRIYDDSMESINAIRNLGIDTSAWGPILAHLICKKLDPKTLAEYREIRKAPREIPTLEELMVFLENKFIALEPLFIKKMDTSERQSPKSNSCQLNILGHHSEPSIDKLHHRNRPANYSKSGDLQYISAPCTLTCPYCSNNHAIYKCDDFIKLNATEKLNATMQLGICQICLLQHEVGQCRSRRSCGVCQGQHNSRLHDAFKFLEQSGSINLHQLLTVPKDHKIVACCVLNDFSAKNFKDTSKISQNHSTGSYRRYINKSPSQRFSQRRRRRRNSQRAGLQLKAPANSSALEEGPKASQHQAACDKQCVLSVSRYKYYGLNVPAINKSFRRESG